MWNYLFFCYLDFLDKNILVQIAKLWDSGGLSPQSSPCIINRGIGGSEWAVEAVYEYAIGGITFY